MDFINSILLDLVFMLAIVNPVSKIFIVATMSPPCSQRQINFMARRANITAGLILIATALAGSLFLSFFNIHISSLRVAGGIVMFLIGLQMVNDTGLAKPQDGARFEDVAIVPLATPMTAGPGSIAAVIALSAQRGSLSVVLVVILTLLANYILMRASNRIGRVLVRFRLMNPLAKLTGLLVTAIAAEMLLSGLGEWLKMLFADGS